MQRQDPKPLTLTLTLTSPQPFTNPNVHRRAEEGQEAKKAKEKDGKTEKKPETAKAGPSEPRTKHVPGSTPIVVDTAGLMELPPRAWACVAGNGVAPKQALGNGWSHGTPLTQ